MTSLTKPVSRLTTRLRDRGRPIVVTLEPGDTITFRAKGTRTLYRTSREAWYMLSARAAAREQADLAAMDKAERRRR
jgi:hypothetical protein